MKRITPSNIFLITLLLMGVVLLTLWACAVYVRIEDGGVITYGVSFSKYRSDEMGVPWKETFMAAVNDLGVRYFRLSSRWRDVEPIRDGEDNFAELDYELEVLKRVGGRAVVAVGRRTPGWPECHEPDWIVGLTQTEKEQYLLDYIKTTVLRYRNSSALEYWQVENEPFLTVFATYHCGITLDQAFLEKEIALVKSLDPKHPILVTDSGEISNWRGAYKAGDVFGTSIYVFIWSPQFGRFKYFFPAMYFDLKRGLVELLYGKKPSMIIELGAEPWLLEPTRDASLSLQLSRMNINSFNEIIDLAQTTSFNRQYLWGIEWWYYLKQQGIDAMWNRARELYQTSVYNKII